MVATTAVIADRLSADRDLHARLLGDGRQVKQGVGRAADGAWMTIAFSNASRSRSVAE
jgi:hypothetical protein